MLKVSRGVFAAFLACSAFVGGAVAVHAADQPDASSKDSRLECKANAQSDIEKERQQARRDATKSLDDDAVSAIQETQAAVKAISESKTQDAISHIESATGKINVLLARNPADALIPVDVSVDVIDAAPADIKEITRRGAAAQLAVEQRDYPAARVLLMGLVSELRVRTYNLPLATYPVAMQEAAKLLDQKKDKEAQAILRTALETLVVVDRSTPIPVIVSQAAVKDAEEEAKTDKPAAQRLLAVAKDELERAQALGYAGQDPTYSELSQAISNLDGQLNGNSSNEETASAFDKLKEKIASFFHRQSMSEKRSELAANQ